MFEYCPTSAAASKYTLNTQKGERSVIEKEKLAWQLSAMNERTRLSAVVLELFSWATFLNCIWDNLQIAQDKDYASGIQHVLRIYNRKFVNGTDFRANINGVNSNIPFKTVHAAYILDTIYIQTVAWFSNQSFWNALES